jgi:hypothetical protein
MRPGPGTPPVAARLVMLSSSLFRHCEARSGEAIHSFIVLPHGLLRFARNDGQA